jgi:hypothetical protein
MLPLFVVKFNDLIFVYMSEQSYPFDENLYTFQ